jgi:outer membrane protein TolC
MFKYGFGQPRHQLAVPTAISTVALLLSGCMVGPNYHKPAAPVPPAFQEPTVPPPAGQNAIGYSDWWKVFNDPTLDGLEVQADAANKDIKIAIAHVDEATATTKAVHSFLLPTIRCCAQRLSHPRGAEPAKQRQYQWARSNLH